MPYQERRYSMQERLTPGDRAPAGKAYDIHAMPIELGDSWSSGPTLLVFLRHFGCIFCREWMADIERHKEQIEAAGLSQVILVALGEPKHAAFFGPLLAPSALCYATQSSDLYAAYGLSQGKLGQLVGPRTALSALRATAKGKRQGTATGDVKMLGGTFIVDRAGTIQFAHYSQFAGDNPDLDQLLSQPINHSSQKRGESHAALG